MSKNEQLEELGWYQIKR